MHRKVWSSAAKHYYWKSDDSHNGLWSFIPDDKDGSYNTRRNIAYNLQYLQWMMKFYNMYVITSTVESLFFKNIEMMTFSILELALRKMIPDVEEKYRQYKNTSEKNQQNSDPAFWWLLKTAEDEKGISPEMKSKLHRLRERRNNMVHLSSIKEPEYNKYTIEDANEAIATLNEFQTLFSNKSSVEANP